ncbi:hypothetical protein FIBSPDRAFT_903635 [Athelia psychrophila]|uniref:Uncharacterized protein n=1 Tax=Athelia psychrophila TaxID=1759441 RepID=A0A167VRE1_9AGAM|nr:hypothetical protein FIBSPDRAFT_903635 [Fibularhizoctonia sp. CBS 109695]
MSKLLMPLSYFEICKSVIASRRAFARSEMDSGAENSSVFPSPYTAGAEWEPPSRGGDQEATTFRKLLQMAARNERVEMLDMIVRAAGRIRRIWAHLDQLKSTVKHGASLNS